MSEVTELEKSKEDYQKRIATKNAILELQKNPIFIQTILKEYCVEECARYIGAAGDPAIGKDDRDLALEMAKAGQHLKRWLDVSIRMGEHAESQMESLEEAINLARQEEEK